MNARELMARALYAHWCETAYGPEGDGDAPDWPAFEAGADLNPVGLSRGHFEEDAENLFAAIDKFGFTQDLLDKLPG